MKVTKKKKKINLTLCATFDVLLQNCQERKMETYNK